MAVADFLKDVGQGLATGAKAVGAVAKPVLARTAEVVSGEAPEMDAEKRKQAEKLEDEQIATQAKLLEDQLATGQRYGTLTPEQQKQYVDKITGLYSHPRHAATLMERLHKAVHPHGAFSQAPEPALPDATPPGGTFQQEENAKAEAEARKLLDAENLATFRNGLPKKSASKSPPLTGDKLPTGAMGADGNPISEADRNAGKSFVEWNNQWWPVAKPKPAFKTVKGHSVLVDSQSGAILRDLGPVGAAKVTTRQTLQPGDDGQMHLVNLTSVTTPEGAQIEVEPEAGAPPVSSGSPTSSPAAPNSSAAPKTPAKKVGAILPKTGAKPVAPTGQSGPVVPGLTSLAKSKTLAGKSEGAQYTKAAEDANAKKIAYQNAQGLLADPNRQTDLELVYAWVRSNVQGAGRMTNTEIQQTATAGSWGMRAKNAVEKAMTGRLAPEMEQQFLGDIKRGYENSQKEADDLKKQLEGPGSSPDAGGASDIDDIVNALKKGAPKTP